MSRRPVVRVVIPALNEEQAVGQVVGDLLRVVRPAEVIVVDNGSTDRTAKTALAAGATVVSEPRRGYGRACLTGMARLREGVRLGRPTDFVLFSDADASETADDMRRVVAHCIGRRLDAACGLRDAALAMPLQQRFGNALASGLIWLLYGRGVPDLSPVKCVRFDALERLGLSDPGMGWSVEFFIKALKSGLRIEFIPVEHRPRIGTSKVSGTLRGTMRAGVKIIWKIVSLRLAE